MASTVTQNIEDIPLVSQILTGKGFRSLNAYDSLGKTPLTVACDTGNVELVQFLLSKGAAVNLPERGSNHTPLYVASRVGSVDIVKLLLTQGADVNIASLPLGLAPLYIASNYGHAGVVSVLLKANSDPNKYYSGFPPIYCACLHKHVDVMRVLIEEGHADPNKATFIFGSTALLTACLMDFKPAVFLLLQHNANPMQLTLKGNTPLHATCVRGLTSIVEALVTRSNVDINFGLPGNDASPLYVACRAGRVSVVEFLLKAGANVNKPTADGVTPLGATQVTGQLKCLRNHDLVKIDSLQHWKRLQSTTGGYLCACCGATENRFPAMYCDECMFPVCPECLPSWLEKTDAHKAIETLLRDAGGVL